MNLDDHDPISGLYRTRGSSIQTKLKAGKRAKGTAKAINAAKAEGRNSAVGIKRNDTIGEETRTAAEEATEIGRTDMEVVEELKDMTSPVWAQGQMGHITVMAYSMLSEVTQSGFSLALQLHSYCLVQRPSSHLSLRKSAVALRDLARSHKSSQPDAEQ